MAKAAKRRVGRARAPVEKEAENHIVVGRAADQMICLCARRLKFEQRCLAEVRQQVDAAREALERRVCDLDTKVLDTEPGVRDLGAPALGHLRSRRRH